MAKIVVFYGSPRKGNTYQATNMFIDELKKYGDIQITEFSFPKDMPEFCRGCFQCFKNGEESCPHANYVQPIVKEMEEADGFIFSSPVYVMQISGAIKAFLDHMAYNYMSHRPRFFRQKAMIISTTAGAGLKNCIGYMTENLTYWGINKIYSLGISMFAISWEDMEQKRKDKAMKAIAEKAKVFYKDLDSGKLHEPSAFQVMMFHVSKVLMNSYDEGNLDKAYWREKGWSDLNTGYFQKDIKIHIFKKLFGNLTSTMFGSMLKSNNDSQVKNSLNH